MLNKISLDIDEIAKNYQNKEILDHNNLKEGVNNE